MQTPNAQDKILLKHKACGRCAAIFGIPHSHEDFLPQKGLTTL
jgi:hypothetical protein